MCSRFPPTTAAVGSLPITDCPESQLPTGGGAAPIKLGEFSTLVALPVDHNARAVIAGIDTEAFDFVETGVFFGLHAIPLGVGFRFLMGPRSDT